MIQTEIREKNMESTDLSGRCIYVIVAVCCGIYLFTRTNLTSVLKSHTPHRSFAAHTLSHTHTQQGTATDSLNKLINKHVGRYRPEI